MAKYEWPTFKMFFNSDPGQPAVGSISITSEKMFNRFINGERFVIYPIRQFASKGYELIGIDICPIPAEEKPLDIPDWDAGEMVERFMRMCDRV